MCLCSLCNHLYCFIILLLDHLPITFSLYSLQSPSPLPSFIFTTPSWWLHCLLLQILCTNEAAIFIHITCCYMLELQSVLSRISILLSLCCHLFPSLPPSLPPSLLPSLPPSLIALSITAQLLSYEFWVGKSPK